MYWSTEALTKGGIRQHLISRRIMSDMRNIGRKLSIVSISKNFNNGAFLLHCNYIHDSNYIIENLGIKCYETNFNGLK